MSSSEKINPSFAVLLAKHPDQKSMMTYVKSVSAVVGSSNIVAVFNTNRFVKVYLKSEKHVHLLINGGLSMLAHHSNVEFAVPRGTKVVLSNVDPVVPDEDLLRLLHSYGTLESGLMYKKPFADEYSHIKSDVRYIYMNLFDKKNFPTKLDWMLDDAWHEIFVSIEEPTPLSRSETPEESQFRLSGDKSALAFPNRFPSTSSSETYNFSRNPSVKMNRVSVAGKASRIARQTGKVRFRSSIKVAKKRINNPAKKVFKRKGGCVRKIPGRPHSTIVKRIMKYAPIPMKSGFPMDPVSLCTFFEKYNQSDQNIVDLSASLLNDNSPLVLQKFKNQLDYLLKKLSDSMVKSNISRCITELDTYLSNNQTL